MIPLSKIAWGPDDALAKDSKFAAKWIEPNSIEVCLDENNWIVSGEKGSGKSAINRALKEIHRDKFDIVSSIDFNGLTFSSLYGNIVSFAKTTQLDRTVTLSQYWMFSIVVELIKESVRAYPNIYGEVFKRSTSFDTSVSVHDRLLKLMEGAWNKIDQITGAKGKKRKKKSTSANLIESGGITASELSELARFPIGEKFQKLKKDYFDLVSRHEHKIMLIMDGLDKIDNRDIDHNSVGLIFSSLVDATVTLKNDKDIPDGIFLKIIIPHDRYISLRLRDSDKVDLCHASIRWNRDTLKEFIRRRIEVSVETQFSNFELAWKNVFPDTVINRHYGLSEDTFDYVVRHTMYRPRQLQIHLQQIAKKYKGKLIEPSMISGCVAESCASLTRHFVNEYSIDHPNLSKLLQMFDRRDNVMEFKVFRDIVSTAISRFSSSGANRPNVDDKIDSLFMIGFFGVVNFFEPSEIIRNTYIPPTKEGQRHYVDFFFKTARFSIVGTLRDESLVALHPIFVEGANLRPHPAIIVG
ncbi:MAG: hypothetical protein HY242_01525 [Afipia sp.]|nr:hypothetical protein [Afipia sp.]